MNVVLRPGRLVAYAWLLALVPIAALQLAHADLHEAHELPGVLHWLRDGALAVPLAAAAAVTAALVVGRSGRNDPASLGTHLKWALLASAIFAILSIPANQIHALVFDAQVEVDEAPLVDALLDGIYAMQFAAVLMVPLVLAVGVPWRRSSDSNTEGAEGVREAIA